MMCLCTVHLEDQREGRWEGERERERGEEGEGRRERREERELPMYRGQRSMANSRPSQRGRIWTETQRSHSFLHRLAFMSHCSHHVHTYMYNVCKQLMYITLKCCGFETHQGQLFFQSKTVVLAFAFICDLFAVTRTTHYCLTYRLIVLDR
ncbi:hypothetical protein GBAR_LOCUS3799 [Geodia barretti]|uniref:Uncharacterized protein n=1 Tax=Geodia barretti TaxID=519541 RepID=A0AA35R6A2_GEOBA|nr:hypothetical protein GBAR_LOCUS3799 [Geodia barretti]